MHPALRTLLARPDVELSEPADPDAIAALNIDVPPILHDLWTAADGVGLTSLDAHLLGPGEILHLLESDETQEFATFLRSRGLVPLLDTHQSNYVMLAITPQLAPRLLWFPHDDDTRVLYRNTETLFTDLLAYLESAATEDEIDDLNADSFFHNAPGDYAPDAPRPSEDKAAAQTLLSEPYDESNWNLAIQLLDATNLDDFARLLETDHFIRRDVRGRMEKISSPAIQSLLNKDTAAYDAFCEHVQLIAQSAGLSSTGNWNLDAFFHLRNQTNADAKLAQWFADIKQGLNPRDRPDNYMAARD